MTPTVTFCFVLEQAASGEILEAAHLISNKENSRPFYFNAYILDIQHSDNSCEPGKLDGRN